MSFLPQSLAAVGRAVVVALRLLVLLPVAAVSSVLLLRSRHSQGVVVPAWTASDALWSDADRDIEISVVIPFYNPGAAMRPTVDRLVGALRAAGVGFEVICVSDGSTDGSERTLDGCPDEVRVLVNPVNRGKGAALHTGFSHARGAFVGMVDCDGDIDPVHLLEYLIQARESGAQVVYADKRLGESTSASSPARKLVSFGFSSVVGTMFALGVRDTQTGCKLFSRSALQSVLPRLREERFAFDLEFFVAAKAAGVTSFRAAPVALSERLAGSTVTVKTIMRTLADALTVFGRLHLTRVYRTAAAPIPVQATVVTLPAARTAPDLRLAA
jgi:glycosyltransferase involved in cell wall biosynthesis